MQFCIHNNFLSCFYMLIFYFEMNSQLEPDVCGLLPSRPQILKSLFPVERVFPFFDVK